MVLTIDIGNSNIVLGVFDRRELLFTARISTDINKTADELAVMMNEIFTIRKLDSAAISGSIISSVVPALTSAMSTAAELITGKAPFLVAPGIKTGLNIRIDNPAQLGSDLLVDCVAAAAMYPKPVIVADMGTATTLSVVDEGNNMLGGAIMPGVRTALNALISKTAQLPQISIDSPKKAIGTNTNDSMRSGIVLGSAGMLDGMIERFEEELGREAFVVATGGLSGEICKHTRKKILHNPDLLLQGLYILYLRNNQTE
ncbi:MAG: type III pantothenate kinase [Clostridia bacterium]|nr:type III pantothenate kinase [Clostridia bacterium]